IRDGHVTGVQTCALPICCVETWISGTGLEKDFERATRVSLRGPEIIARSEAGEPDALDALERFEDRLARGLAGVINLLDPDVIEIGRASCRERGEVSDVA